MSKVIKVKVTRVNDKGFNVGYKTTFEEMKHDEMMILANQLMEECNKLDKDSMSGVLVLDVETDSTGDNLLLETDLLDVIDGTDIVLFQTTDKKLMTSVFDSLSESIDKGVGLVRTTRGSSEHIVSVGYKTKEVLH